MHSTRFILFLFILFSFTCLHAATYILTFDDVPGRKGWMYTPAERSKRIAQNSPKGSVFFFVGKQAPSNFFQDELKMIEDHGHYLGNHTFDHQDIDRAGQEKFLSSITRNQQLVSKSLRGRSWFRYPFLNESNDPQLKLTVKSKLHQLGYNLFPVTVETWDWKLDDLLFEAKTKGKKVDLEKIRKLYVKMVVENFQFYEDLRIQNGIAPFTHVVLLHYNDLSAYFIAHVVDELKRRGHTPVDAQDYMKMSHDSMRPMVEQMLKKGVYRGQTPLWLDLARIEDSFRQIQ